MSSQAVAPAKENKDLVLGIFIGWKIVVDRRPGRFFNDPHALIRFLQSTVGSVKRFSVFELSGGDKLEQLGGESQDIPGSPAYRDHKTGLWRIGTPPPNISAP